MEEKRHLVLIPYLSIHPNHISFYKSPHWLPTKPIRTEKINEAGERIIKYGHLLQSSRSAEGLVSKIAKRKINRAIDYLLLLSKNKVGHSHFSGKMFNFKISFITLTLPSDQVHDDNIIKNKCLNSFLLELKKFYQVKNYIWRAEKQKNGNIHFHILTDKFIPWSELRDRWNRIVNKLGYVDRYRENMKKWHAQGFRVRKDLLAKWSYNKQKESYFKNLKKDFNSPNSTDIHSIKKIKNIKLYISKYLTKQEQNEPLGNGKSEEIVKQKGRIWGCSQNLSNIKGAQIIIDSETEDELDRIIHESNCDYHHDTYYSIFYIDLKTLVNLRSSVLFKSFASYIMEKFGQSLPFEIDFRSGHSP